MKRFAFLAALAAAALLIGGDLLIAQPVTGKVKLAFITNNTSDYWTICR